MGRGCERRDVGEHVLDSEAWAGLGGELIVAVEGGIGVTLVEVAEQVEDGLVLCRGHRVGRYHPR